MAKCPDSGIYTRLCRSIPCVACGKQMLHAFVSFKFNLQVCFAFNCSPSAESRNGNLFAARVGFAWMTGWLAASSVVDAFNGFLCQFAVLFRRGQWQLYTWSSGWRHVININTLDFAMEHSERLPLFVAQILRRHATQTVVQLANSCIMQKIPTNYGHRSSMETYDRSTFVIYFFIFYYFFILFSFIISIFYIFLN